MACSRAQRVGVCIRELWRLDDALLAGRSRIQREDAELDAEFGDGEDLVGVGCEVDVGEVVVVVVPSAGVDLGGPGLVVDVQNGDVVCARAEQAVAVCLGDDVDAAGVYGCSCRCRWRSGCGCAFCPLEESHAAFDLVVEGH